MSRRAAIVEEFDDDTDLALPHRPLANTGTRGAILQELSDTDDDDDDAPSSAGPASPSQTHFKSSVPDENGRTVTDITPYKKWTCVYPIYIDAKRPSGRGERRIARAKSVWWPLSKDIADATNRLGLGTLHEIGKAHPRDWENPGRVRVQWRKDGRLMNPSIRTKKQLLERIAQQIQLVKPDSVPRPPYNSAQSESTGVESAQAATPKPAATAVTKGKQPAPAKGSKATTPSATATISSAAPVQSKNRRPKPPSPPQPYPPLTSRVSPYSPALPSGVLIETIKAGINAQEAAPGVGGGSSKGKRKVVRVRQ
ncbi:hypothetical protein POSPLADRAFT_1039573 [Postia placenta MAD-698-R-SB12]|uniref:Signal recognition particle SRP19 subunit n=1 Tax=Postia placenta MAD-698-R-SB12 TaxID=670580 RepID=A0A1X6N4I4_9APHY|nr:hypothetical protein POSPLADRAFT_1039573 [Postia placenta MAD-698-R-SB12]OSX63517.1 hypothetical protein POSPLADRAFT_1039573 [Postia placenta MAD-698-R-SB12]